MKETVYLLLIWLGVMSALAFVLFGWDKLSAKRHCRRVPEAALLGCAFLGGSAGAALGMALFRHKTRKPLFRRFVPLCLIAHAALLAWAAFFYRLPAFGRNGLPALPFSGEKGRFLLYIKILSNILLTSGGSGVILTIVTIQLQTVTTF